MPVIMILGMAGVMIGIGGSALVSKTRGEGDPKQANGIHYACRRARDSGRGFLRAWRTVVVRGYTCVTGGGGMMTADFSLPRAPRTIAFFRSV